MRTLSGLPKSRLRVYGELQIRFESVLLVAFEYAMLTHCNFYHVFNSATLFVHVDYLCICDVSDTIIVVFQFTAHSAINVNPDTIWTWKVNLGFALFWIHALT